MGKQVSLPKSSNIELFRILSTEISEIGARQGITITPFHSDDLPSFSKLSDECQSNILNQLSCYIEICKETLSAYGDLNFSVQMVWVALKELQLIPCSDLFTKVTNDDVIEIHDLQNRQIFRNLKYFEFCSYTLEDIHCVPWTNGFGRAC